MKKKQFQQLRNRNTEDLKRELKSREESLMKLEEDLASGKVKNVKGIHVIQKDIAQILTLIREKASVDVTTKQDRPAGQALLREKKSV